jgi:prolyl-tRNA synthetase
MYVVFTKDHQSGFKKGDVRNLSESLANRLIEEKVAKKSSKADYDKHISGLKPKSTDAYEANKKAVNSSNGGCEDCDKEDCDGDCGEEAAE